MSAGGRIRDKKKMCWHGPLGAKGAIGAEKKRFGLMQKESQWEENRKSIEQVSKRKPPWILHLC